MEMKQVGLRGGARFPRPLPQICVVINRKKFRKETMKSIKPMVHRIIAASRGRQGRASIPFGPNSFIFMQFSLKNWELAPPSGKSWIRHCRRVRTQDGSDRCLSQQLITQTLNVQSRQEHCYSTKLFMTLI